MKFSEISAILQTGLAGLAFLLALLSYSLLAREQRSTNIRPEILKAARTFFVLCLVLALFVGVFHIGDRLVRGVESESARICAKSLDNLRVESRNARTLDQLREAVSEQDSACRLLLKEVGNP